MVETPPYLYKLLEQHLSAFYKYLKGRIFTGINFREFFSDILRELFFIIIGNRAKDFTDINFCKHNLHKDFAGIEFPFWLWKYYFLGLIL